MRAYEVVPMSVRCCVDKECRYLLKLILSACNYLYNVSCVVHLKYCTLISQTYCCKLTMLTDCIFSGQVYHKYLNEKKIVIVDHKALNKSYIDGEISLTEYDNLKFPERKLKNDIIALNYPLPMEGETCIICNREKAGVIKCQNCVNMVCCECIVLHFTASTAEDESHTAHNYHIESVKNSDKIDENNTNKNATTNNTTAVNTNSHKSNTTSSTNTMDSKGSFLLLHHKYCMKLGKLPDVHTPFVQEPAYLRKFRETSRTAVIAKLTPPPKDTFQVEVEVVDVEDAEERAYRLQQEAIAAERAEKEKQRLAIENPPILQNLRVEFNEKKKKFHKMEKEITDYLNKINDTSHTEQFIARNVRLKNELVVKLFATVRDPLEELKQKGVQLSLQGEFIESFYRDIDKVLRIIQMFTIT